jgi:hypothetical protein
MLRWLALRSFLHDEEKQFFALLTNIKLGYLLSSVIIVLFE